MPEAAPRGSAIVVMFGRRRGLRRDGDRRPQCARLLEGHRLPARQARLSLAGTEHRDVSLGGGLHFGNTDFGELWGYGGTAIASYTLPGTWLTLNGALDFGIDRFDFNRSGEQKFGTRSDEVHGVPGLQYRVSERVDVIGEIGVGLTDDARDYAALGFSIYFTHRPPPQPR